MSRETKRPVYVTPSQTIDLLSRHGIRLRKGLGQHFLVDNNVLLKILNAATISPADTVLEIGPGVGSLTKGIAEHAQRVVAVEIDNRMAACFRDNVAAPNVTLLQMDALELTPAHMSGPNAHPTRLVAKLPYNIAVLLLLQLLERFPGLGEAVVMVQKEVADRLGASPATKEYGGVTVKLAYYGSVRRLFVVAPTVFVPPPRVESAVVRITRTRTDVADRDRVFALIDAAFSQRRKKLANALAATGVDKNDAEKGLRSAGVDPMARAEELRVSDFVRLSETLPGL